MSCEVCCSTAGRNKRSRVEFVAQRNTPMSSISPVTQRISQSNFTAEENNPAATECQALDKSICFIKGKSQSRYSPAEAQPPLPHPLKHSFSIVLPATCNFRNVLVSFDARTFTPPCSPDPPFSAFFPPTTPPLATPPGNTPLPPKLCVTFKKCPIITTARVQVFASYNSGVSCT